MMSRGANEPEHAWVLTGINLKLALTVSSSGFFNLVTQCLVLICSSAFVSELKISLTLLMLGRTRCQQI